MKRLMVLLAVLGVTSLSTAQEHAPAPTGESHATEHVTAHPTTGHSASDTHPVLSQNSNWAGSMVIIVMALFVCAAVVGVVVRLNMPEPPPEPAHDDHAHGAGHGHDDHGHGGGHGGGHGH